MSQFLPTNPSESFRKRNQHLYGGSVPAPVKVVDSATGRISFNEKSPRRIRQDQKPLMNGLETKLFTVLLAGEWYGRRVSNLRGQAMRFKLSNGAWYKPDITCLMDGQQTCFECKGPKQMKSMDRAMLVIKVAAFQYPEITWFLAWQENGVWAYQKILP